MYVEPYYKQGKTCSLVRARVTPRITARFGKYVAQTYDILKSSAPKGTALFLIGIDGQFFDRSEDMIG